MPTMFRKAIEVGQYRYWLRYDGHDFHLAYENNLIGNQYRVDPGLVFWDDVPELITRDLNLDTNVFALARIAMRVMAEHVCATQPRVFSLIANSPRKAKPYQRFAKRLHRYVSHLYDLELVEQGAVFRFAKKAKAERENLPIKNLKPV